MNGWSERLGQGEKVASASALALFACMFLSWFNFGFETENACGSVLRFPPAANSDDWKRPTACP